MVFNNILRAFNVMTGANELKIKELKDLREEFRSKGYNELWEIPPGPKKERWIKLLKDLGIKVSDPVDRAREVFEDKRIPPRPPPKPKDPKGGRILLFFLLALVYVWTITGYLYEYTDQYTGENNLIWYDLDAGSWERIKPIRAPIILSRSSSDRILNKSLAFGSNK